MRKIPFGVASLLLCGFAFLGACNVSININGNSSKISSLSSEESSLSEEISSVEESTSSSEGSSSIEESSWSVENSSVHTHEFASEWKTDESWHWVECPCGQMAGFVEHEYGEWQTNSESLWKECVCGKPQNSGEHQVIIIEGEFFCEICNVELGECSHALATEWDFTHVVVVC